MKIIFVLLIYLLTTKLAISQVGKDSIYFFNGQYFNWSYNKFSDNYTLEGFPLGEKILMPSVHHSRFISRKMLYVEGIVIYPKGRNIVDSDRVSNADIYYCVRENKSTLKLLDSLGKSDSLGNFSGKIPNPPKEFYLLFSFEDKYRTAIRLKRNKKSRLFCR